MVMRVYNLFGGHKSTSTEPAAPKRTSFESTITIEASTMDNSHEGGLREPLICNGDTEHNTTTTTNGDEISSSNQILSFEWKDGGGDGIEGGCPPEEDYNPTGFELDAKFWDDLLESDEDRPPPPATTEHLGGSRQYWRDIILGVNDGLVSTFLLVAGVAGGGLESKDILITAIAGAIAGAVSMCAGEYVATKSQNQVMYGEIELEQEHIAKYRIDELREVPEYLELIGIRHKGLQKKLLRYYASDLDSLLKLHMAIEFGFLEEEQRSPEMAGLVSCFLFLAGSIPSILPFCIPDVHPKAGLLAAALASLTALLVVGAIKTWASRGNCLQSAVENLIVAGCGGVIAYGTGLLFDLILHQPAA